MKIRESAQDYLETILILNKENGSVKSIEVANHMGVTKQSVHRAIKNLKEEGYISVDEKGNISLEEKGKQIAEDTYEKHQVLSKFFMSLGVSEDVSYSDACKIEHDISKETFDAIKTIVNNVKK